MEGWPGLRSELQGHPLGSPPRPCSDLPPGPPGVFIPSCDEDGYYRKMQCDRSGGDCWCVDQLGLELTGTRTHGSPDCGKGRSPRGRVRGQGRGPDLTCLFTHR